MDRLYEKNVDREYPNLGKIKSTKYLGGKPLLQANYGKDLDCTLTSLSFLFGEKNYDMIESIAVKYGYNGDKTGTFPLVIKSIMREVMKKLRQNGTPKSAYLKGVGWNFEKVKKIIDHGDYILLNLWKDGRNFYADHTVTIVGYIEYERTKFLIVYDNWSTIPSYIDYAKLSKISSLNWYEV